MVLPGLLKIEMAPPTGITDAVLRNHLNFGLPGRFVGEMQIASCSLKIRKRAKCNVSAELFLYAYKLGTGLSAFSKLSADPLFLK